MESVFFVNMLGEFSITYRDKSINDSINRSKKLWTLLEYLITFRQRDISHNELIELLWPDEDISNPSNTLKTLLYRTRTMIEELGFKEGGELIICRRKTYAWNPNIKTQVDADIFDRLCLEADSPGLSHEECLDKLLKAAALYKGDFLPKNDGDSWVVPVSTYYHSKYMKAMGKAVGILKEMGRLDELITLAQKVIIIDPFEEFFHKTLIETLVETGQQQKALKHYRYVMELFYNKFGISPSEDLTALYRNVVKTSNYIELDLEIIKEGLREKNVQLGAFYCEFEFFKNIYHLEARATQRTGHAVFIAIITVTDEKERKPDLKRLGRIIQNLKEIISVSLRSSDIYTRYSVSQFLLMIPGTSYENTQKVLQRIIRAYKKNNPKAPFQLSTSIAQLSPNM